MPFLIAIAINLALWLGREGGGTHPSVPVSYSFLSAAEADLVELDDPSLDTKTGLVPTPPNSDNTSYSPFTNSLEPVPASGVEDASPPPPVASIPPSFSAGLETSQADATDMAIGLLPLEQDLWQRLNLERTKAGINPLTIDDDLVAVARERSQSMVNLNYFDHTAPDGQTAFSLMAARGITYRNAGEDLASNNYPDDVSPAVAIDYLMNSATHTNILMADYHRIGIGLAISSDGTKYYTLIFISSG